MTFDSRRTTSRTLLILALVQGTLACQSHRTTASDRDPSTKEIDMSETKDANAFVPPWTQATKLRIARLAFDGSGEVFLSHPSYLSLTTPYEPVREFYEQLQKRLGQKLVTRGEAHVTVLTPPEFAAIKELVPMHEIDAIAQRRSLQSTRLEPVCLGVGHADVEGRSESTFFLVVRAPGLIELRREIETRFRAKGGAVEAFSADEFHPHITVGFTKTDLHVQQGVVKGENACAFPLELY